MRMGPSGAYLEFHVPDSITVPLVFVRTVSCVCRTGCNGGGGSGGGGGIRVTTDVSSVRLGGPRLPQNGMPLQLLSDL